MNEVVLRQMKRTRGVREQRRDRCSEMCTMGCLLVSRCPSFNGLSIRSNGRDFFTGIIKQRCTKENTCPWYRHRVKIRVLRRVTVLLMTACALRLCLCVGFWFMKKWNKSLCLSQLALTDKPERKDTFLYKLSKARGEFRSFPLSFCSACDVILFRGEPRWLKHA